MDGGEFPKMGEYEYQYDINGVPYGTTIHEMNHNADYLKIKQQMRMLTVIYIIG